MRLCQKKIMRFWTINASMLAQKSLKPECENLENTFLKHCKFDLPCHSDSNFPLCSLSLQSLPPHPPTVAFPTVVFHCGQTPVVLHVYPWVLLPHLSWQRSGYPLSTPTSPRSCPKGRLFTPPFLWTSEPLNSQHCPSCPRPVPNHNSFTFIY